MDKGDVQMLGIIKLSNYQIVELFYDSVFRKGFK